MLRVLSVHLKAASRNAIFRPSCIAAVRPLHSSSARRPAPPRPQQLSDDMAPFRTNSADHGFVWTSRFGEISVPDVTVEEYVWKNVAQWQHRTAIVCGVTGRQYTYAKLRDHCAAVAHRLRSDFNLQRGDVVAIAMPNVPEYAIVVLGALEAGLTLTTINPVYTSGLNLPLANIPNTYYAGFRVVYR